MRLADGLLVGAGHEAEGLPFLQIHMRGMTESAELFGGFLERVKLLEELFFAEFLAGKLPLFLSCVSMKYLTVMLLLSEFAGTCCAYTQHDVIENLSCVLSHVRLLMSASFVFRMR